MLKQWFAFLTSLSDQIILQRSPFLTELKNEVVQSPIPNARSRSTNCLCVVVLCVDVLTFQCFKVVPFFWFDAFKCFFIYLPKNKSNEFFPLGSYSASRNCNNKNWNPINFSVIFINKPLNKQHTNLLKSQIYSLQRFK